MPFSRVSRSACTLAGTLDLMSCSVCWAFLIPASLTPLGLARGTHTPAKAVPISAHFCASPTSLLTSPPGTPGMLPGTPGMLGVLLPPPVVVLTLPLLLLPLVAWVWLFVDAVVSGLFEHPAATPTVRATATNARDSFFMG